MKKPTRAVVTSREQQRLQDRGTGRTTKQMVNAPKGSVFVWLNDNLFYPKRLARHIGREDLHITSPGQLRNFAGLRNYAFVVDHAASLSAEQQEYIRVMARDVPTQSPADGGAVPLAHDLTDQDFAMFWSRWFESSPKATPYQIDFMRGIANDAVKRAGIAAAQANVQPKGTKFEAVERALELSSLHAGSVAMSDRDGATAYRQALRDHLFANMRPGADVGVALLERLIKTMTRLGIATPEGGVEHFAARLEDQLYSLCRGVDHLFDSLPSATTQAPAPGAQPEEAQHAAWRNWADAGTVGSLIAFLATLDQAAPIVTAYHVTMGSGERRCKTRSLTISRERVDHETSTIRTADKSLPYTHVLWAQPPEEVQATAVAPGDAKDAARYRWLRDEALWDETREGLAEIAWCVIGSAWDDCRPTSTDELDAAIDAAMASRPPVHSTGGERG